MAESSWAMPGGNDSLEVYGPGGRLVANLERGPAIAAYSFAGTEESTHGGPRGGWHYETYEDAWQFGFPQEIQHFVDVIEGRAGLESSGEDGRRVLEIICAAYESARLRARVALPFASTARKPIEHWWG
jgi:predicted dehydrogenase